jgi:hypothetical protein
MRDLKNTDYSYLELLNSELSNTDFDNKFEKYSNNQNYFIKVMEVDSKIVAAGSLLIKPKFIRNMNFFGIIMNVVGEDKFTIKIMERLIQLARDNNCCLIDIKLNKSESHLSEILKLKDTKLSITSGLTWENRQVIDDKTRLLELDDYDKDFLNVMRDMYHVRKIDKNAFKKHFEMYKKTPDYFIFVKELNNKILATGSIQIVDNFKSLKRVAIMDDVIVHRDYRLQNFSRLIIEELNDITKKNNCFEFMGKIRSTKMDYWLNVIPSTKLTGENHYMKVL